MEKNKLLFEQLYTDYYSEIYRFIYFHLRNQQDSEDLVSDTFLEVWNGLDKPKENYRAWIYRVAKNNLYDKFKSFDHRNVVKDSSFSDTIFSKNEIEKEIDMKDLYENVIKKIDLLKGDLKEAIMLRYVQDLEYSEIAQIMNKTEVAIRILVTKALKQLRIDTEEDRKKLIALPAIFTPSLINTNFEFIKTNILNQTIIESSKTGTLMGSAVKAGATTATKATAIKIAVGIAAVAVVAGIGGFVAVKNLSPKSNEVKNNATASVTTTVTSTVPTETTKTTETTVITPIKKLDLNNTVAVYKGVKDASSNGLSGKYAYFQKCDTDTSSCTNYLLKESALKDFKMISSQDGTQNPERFIYEYAISGNIKPLGVAAGTSYYEIIDNVKILLVVEYMGFEREPYGTSEGHVFNACYTQIKRCDSYSLDQSRVDDFPALQNLQKNQLFGISGDTEDKGAVVPGATYSQLTTNVVIERL